MSQRTGCRVAGLKTGNWVMLDDPDGFRAEVMAWLNDVALPGVAATMGARAGGTRAGGLAARSFSAADASPRRPTDEGVEARSGVEPD